MSTIKLTAADLYSQLYKCCEKVVCEYGTASEQIERVLSDYVNFKHWFNESFTPVLKDCSNSAGKSMEQVKVHREFADLFKNIPESQFVDKAFDHLNQAILNVPFDEHNVIFDLFAKRSNLHYHNNDYEAALRDIDHALKFRLSYTCLERKVNILKKLNRGVEALQLVTDMLNSNETMEKMSESKRESLGKMRKELKRYKSDTKQAGEEQMAKGQYNLKVDSRVKLERNQANRLIFKAKDTIPIGTEVLNEDPATLMFRNTYLQRYCNLCYKKVVNNFWPCQHCNEVVFCSDDCAKEDQTHPLECGMIKMIQANLATQAPQVYRALIKLNFDQIKEIDNESKNFELESVFDKLVTDKSPKRSEVQKYFHLSQAQLMQTINKRKQSRSANEITNAIYLLAIYHFKAQALGNNLEDQSRIQFMVNHISIMILKAIVNEYSWHEINSQQERVQVGHFQCLFGSLVGHKCEPNAEWTFDGQRFLIKTVKQISNDEEIAISYGLTKDSSLYQRQKHLQNFYVMCCCDKCMSDAKQCLTMRCENCHGPIPYHYEEFPNLTCMLCEQDHTNSAILKSVQREMDVAKRAILFIGQMEDEEQLGHIEKMMSTIACYIYLSNENFLSLVRDLCDEYINRGIFQPAIEWFQWLVDGTGIYLSTDSDSLVHFQNLDKWAYAYLNWAEEQLKSGSAVSVTYVKTGAKIIKKLFTILDLINQTKAIDLSIFDKSHTDDLIKQFHIKAQDMSQRYYEISERLRNFSESSKIDSSSGYESDAVPNTESDKNDESVDSCTSSISLQVVM